MPFFGWEETYLALLGEAGNHVVTGFSGGLVTCDDASGLTSVLSFQVLFQYDEKIQHLGLVFFFIIVIPPHTHTCTPHPLGITCCCSGDHIGPVELRITYTSPKVNVTHCAISALLMSISLRISLLAINTGGWLYIYVQWSVLINKYPKQMFRKA